MFTVDLLKGQGIPIRTKPQGVAIFVVTFAVPVIIAIVMVIFYVHSKILIGVQKESIISIEEQTERLAGALKFRDSYEKDRTDINNCLADVATSIRSHMQWSPILVTLVENLPDSVILTGLEVKQQSVKRKVVLPADPTKTVNKSIPVRTLKMKVSGDPSYDCDLEVKAFRDRLRASEAIGPKVEDIVVASQGRDTLDGREVIAYEIECVFKPEL